MDILKKFTLTDIKMNKKRTIVTIIGIMLSTALICGVVGIVSSFQKTFIDMTISAEGDYHSTFKNISKKDAKYITGNNKVESYFLTNRLGWSKLEGSNNKNKPYLSVLSYDETAMDNYGIRLVEGRKPENANEIIISEEIINNARVDLKIGDEITLNIGQREGIDGAELERLDCYWVDEDSEPIEKITDTYSRTYKIVGIMKSPSYKVEEFTSPGYTVITAMEGIPDTANISVLYTKIAETIENNENILATLNLEDKSENIIINKDYLRFSGVLDKGMLNAMYCIAGVVMLIVVASSIFVIRNSFSISVSEKNRQYGMLASIGATSKQIKKNVLYEGFLIGLIAIPLGILLGIVAIVILLKVVNILLVDSLNDFSFAYNLPLIPVIITVIISVITIYLSCLIPARKAAKISPIEAIRGNDDIKIKNKKLKTNRLTKKIFGIGGTIASKNLKRSKKKYRTTIISIVISIAIFVSLSSFVDCGKRETSLYFKEVGYNIEIIENELATYNKILDLDGVEDYSYYYETAADVDFDKFTTEEGRKVTQDLEDSSIKIIACNNEAFKKYLKGLGLDENNYNNSAILIDDFVMNSTDKEKSVERVYNIKEGDKLELSKNGEVRNIEVSKCTDVRPMGFEKTFYTSGLLVVSEDYIQGLNEDDYRITDLFVKANNANDFESRILDLANTNSEFKGVEVYNLEKMLEQENRMVLVIEIFLYGFISVITLIGVTNIFNTITTNMILRSKEFAMLKSIGMTSREFNKMIRLESILYGIKSLLIGIPIGIIGSYFIYKGYAQNIDIGYFVPIKSIIISIVFVFIIIGFTMKYSLNKINRQNIIETIRKENI
ncbi:MAG: FtsX-like permease family protein [Clostridia bacterium]|nr:FtsX-like permease family protein [Clostridia bacterium]